MSYKLPAPAQSTSLAPGFRFHPSDEEVVVYYLKCKVLGLPFRFQAVAEIDVYNSEPWELPDLSLLKSRDRKWFFFSPVDKKYRSGCRLNRTTVQGHWKPTGKDRVVSHEEKPVGSKKTLEEWDGDHDALFVPGKEMAANGDDATQNDDVVQVFVGYSAELANVMGVRA
ncbi:NAC domain containing protein 50-like [Rutidosis leptorrhynchoides]|uniref:NAC domain containing protein 50-like n=1 Tax=Rutidosis leptorrhynchoides TaxID=125765 RepID=UPI003A98D49D